MAQLSGFACKREVGVMDGREGCGGVAGRAMPRQGGDTERGKDAGLQAAFHGRIYRRAPDRAVNGRKVPPQIARARVHVYDFPAKVAVKEGLGMRRVVVTGLGMVSPLACGVEQTWSRLLSGQSAAGTITRFDASHLATTYACEIPRGDGSDGTFNPDDWMEPKEQRKVDEFIVYGMAAAEQAVKDSGCAPTDTESLERTGVMIG